jgi:hypothetical protein
MMISMESSFAEFNKLMKSSKKKLVSDNNIPSKVNLAISWKLLTNNIFWDGIRPAI